MIKIKNIQDDQSGPFHKEMTLIKYSFKVNENAQHGQRSLIYSEQMIHLSQFFLVLQKHTAECCPIHEQITEIVHCESK